MPAFGKTSNKRLDTAHPVLQELFRRVVARRDCFIACGYRNENDQKEAFNSKVSLVNWPDSKHNVKPSMAIDAPPWPEQWKSVEAFLELKNIILQEWVAMDTAGRTYGWGLRWGGDWDGDGDRTDQTFHDLPHWELV